MQTGSLVTSTVDYTNRITSYPFKIRTVGEPPKPGIIYTVESRCINEDGVDCLYVEEFKTFLLIDDVEVPLDPNNWVELQPPMSVSLEELLPSPVKELVIV